MILEKRKKILIQIRESLMLAKRRTRLIRKELKRKKSLMLAKIKKNPRQAKRKVTILTLQKREMIQIPEKRRQRKILE